MFARQQREAVISRCSATSSGQLSDLSGAIGSLAVDCLVDKLLFKITTSDVDDLVIQRKYLLGRLRAHIIGFEAMIEGAWHGSSSPVCRVHEPATVEFREGFKLKTA